MRSSRKMLHWVRLLEQAVANDNRPHPYNMESQLAHIAQKNKVCPTTNDRIRAKLESQLANIVEKNKPCLANPPRSRAICNRHWQWHNPHPPQARIRTLPNRSWQASIKRTSRAQRTYTQPGLQHSQAYTQKVSNRRNDYGMHFWLHNK